MSFRIDLDIFRGPLDLLLYLVRKHELEIVEIPVAPITEQFLEYLALLEQLDVNAVGDFLEMASTLLELKSRMILPQGDVVEEPLDDPRNDLVHRLLEYKQFKDAASMLDERARDWQERFPRLANDMAGFKRNLADEPIRELELWDLVSAFGRLIEQHQSNQPSNIVYDDTPIHVYMERIGHLLDDQPRRGVHRAVPAGHAQVDVDRHVPGHSRVGAASRHARRAKRYVRRNLAATRRGRYGRPGRARLLIAAQSAVRLVGGSISSKLGTSRRSDRCGGNRWRCRSMRGATQSHFVHESHSGEP